MSLKTPNWVEQAKEEVGLCSSNTVPLYTSPTQSDYNCKYARGSFFCRLFTVVVSGLGIPEVKSARPGPPSRPPPPSVKSPVTPRRVPPRAGVISIPINSSAPPSMPPPELPPEDTGIYEEINDDIASAPEPQGPPPPPPRPEPAMPTTPQREPPPVPARSAPPPPLPARPRQ